MGKKETKKNLSCVDSEAGGGGSGSLRGWDADAFALSENKMKWKRKKKKKENLSESWTVTQADTIECPYPLSQLVVFRIFPLS